MRHDRLLVFGLFLSMPCLGTQMRGDTARLARHLERFRGYKVYELSAREYAAIQTQYFSWIESRLKTGQSVEAE